MSRFWCLFVSSFIFCIGQICAIIIENPHVLVLLSGLTGCTSPLYHFHSLAYLLRILGTVAYGFLYGVFPSLVAATFGIGGLSTNWGFMTLAPVIFGNIFNILYGKLPPCLVLTILNTLPLILETG